ncbi:hypothetical protein ABZ540_04400 [Nocardia xishanensis]|uniref:hypothetical protein n=1 Tax=Nocardia xishanensis TaxID=238964 RepID=UPI0033E27270
MAASLACSPLAAAQPAPPLLPPSLVSGSAGAPPIDTGSSSAAIPLDLTPRYAPILPAPTGSYSPAYEPETIAVAPADIELIPAPDTPAEALGLDVGSVRTACTGSAAAGSTALALGSALGSGLVGPGVVGFGSSGSALGSSTGSGLVGPGPSGSALGSAAGSAFGSGALFTCLLLLPMTPPAPAIPLRLDPAAPVPIPRAPAEPVPARAQAQEPTPAALPARPPRAADPQPVEPVADALAWNLLEIVTVLVIAVLTAVRTRVAAGRVPPLPR